MHPQVTSSSPGTCSICGMPLEPIGQEAGAATSQSHDLQRLVICSVLAAVLMAVAMLVMSLAQ